MARISGGRRTRSPKAVTRNSRSVKVGKSDNERTSAATRDAAYHRRPKAEAAPSGTQAMGQGDRDAEDRSSYGNRRRPGDARIDRFGSGAASADDAARA